jgi:hypothetical protein
MFLGLPRRIREAQHNFRLAKHADIEWTRFIAVESSFGCAEAGPADTSDLRLSQNSTRWAGPVLDQVGGFG